MQGALNPQRPLTGPAARGHGFGKALASPGIYPRSARGPRAAAVASPGAHLICSATALQPIVQPRLSSSSNALHMVQQCRRQVTNCRIRSAAAVNPITATRAVDAAANHQPLTQQQLLDLGATFVRCWFAGIAKGPQAVEESLSSILDKNVLLVADRVRQLEDQPGLTEVLAELERAHLEYHRSEYRPMLYAASEQSQRVYALVEGRYQDVGALPGHPATFRISKVHHILALQVGAGGRVQRLWLRRQMTEEDKDELLHDPLACYASPFPRDSLRLADAITHEAASGQMINAIKFWWQAWSSSHSSSSGGSSSGSAKGTSGSSSSGSSSSEHGASSMHIPQPPAETSSATPADPAAAAAAAAAGQQQPASKPRTLRRADPAIAAGHLLAPDFKLWDAYGLWPSMRAKGRRHLNREAAMHHLQQLRYAYNNQLQELDVAVAEGSLVCFSHWQAKLTPRWQAPPSDDETGSSSSSSSDAGSSSSAGSFTVEAMEVDVFNEQLQLQDIWMFRGPIGQQERRLFLEYDRQQAAVQAEQAASSEQGIREQRRAQREQQLAELLSWMNQYQQQWADYVKHVQKALERQQQLAKQQIMQQAYVVDQLQQRYQELQQEQQQQMEAALAAAAELAPESPAAAAVAAAAAAQQEAAAAAAAPPGGVATGQQPQVAAASSAAPAAAAAALPGGAAAGQQEVAAPAAAAPAAEAALGQQMQAAPHGEVSKQQSDDTQ